MASIVFLSSGRVMTDPAQLFEELAKRPVRTRRMIDLDQLRVEVDNLAGEWEAAAVASRSKEVKVYVRLILEDLRELFDLQTSIEISKATMENELASYNSA